MKLGVFTVSMPEYDPIQALELLAALGYDGVEWRLCEDAGDRAQPSFWSGNRAGLSAAEALRRAPELKARAVALKLAMPSVGAYLSCFAEDAVIETHLQATAALGARTMRIGVGAFDRAKGSFAEHVQRARRRYAEAAALASRYNVRAVIETHMGTLTPSVMVARSILEGLDPAQVGIMWDPGNQVVEGSETYAMALDIAGPYLAEVHAKNLCHRPGAPVNGRTPWKAEATPLREGLVDWPAVVAALKAAGYDGWLVFEDFSTMQPTAERLRDNLAWFRELLRISA